MLLIEMPDSCWSQPRQGDRLRYVLEVVDEPEAEWESRELHYDLATRRLSMYSIPLPRILIEMILRRANGTGIICTVGFDKLELIVEVAGEGKGFKLVNYTIVFTNVSFVEAIEGACSSMLRLPIERVVTSPEGERIFCGWKEGEHSLSKLLLVNETTGEAQDYASGAKYGEWVFWLRPDESRFNVTFVLFGYEPAIERARQDGGVIELPTGIANLVLVNFSATDTTSYALNEGSVLIEPVDTVVGRGWWSSYMEAILREFPQAYSAPHLIDPSKLARFVEERTLSSLRDCEKVSRYKPWKVLLEREQVGSFGELPRLALEYAGTRLTPYGGCDFKAVYDRANLVLIYLKLNLEAPTFLGCRKIQPLFGYLSDEGLMVEWNMLLSKGIPALRLVESTLHTTPVKLGGSGRVDLRAHVLAATAVVAVALALLIALRGGRGR